MGVRIGYFLPPVANPFPEFANFWSFWTTYVTLVAYSPIGNTFHTNNFVAPACRLDKLQACNSRALFYRPCFPGGNRIRRPPRRVDAGQGGGGITRAGELAVTGQVVGGVVVSTCGRGRAELRRVQQEVDPGSVGLSASMV